MISRTLANVTALVLMACSTLVVAATQTVDLQTTSRTNAIYLWADNAHTSLGNPQFLNSAMNDWYVFRDTGTALYLTGSDIDAGFANRGLYSVDMQSSREIAFQWAEVFWDAGVANVERAMSITWRQGRGWRFSNNFTRSADIVAPDLAVSSVPVPPAVLLLASALAGLAGFVRKPLRNAA